MTYRIKNWRKFQHFKDRRPPWIKLYRDLLDDRDWHLLGAEASKFLVMLWLLASEDETQEGLLPDVTTITFRFRLTEKETRQRLAEVSKWVEQDDIATISERYHDGPPETETETETETDQTCSNALSESDWPSDYPEQFWKQYPRRVGKLKALQTLERIKKRGDVSFAVLMAGVARIPTTNPQYIPHPTTWLNRGGWDDEVLPNGGRNARPETSGERARQFARQIREKEIQSANSVGGTASVLTSD